MKTFIIALVCIIALAVIGAVVYLSVLDAKDETDDMKRFDNRGK